MLPHALFRHELLQVLARMRSNESPEAAKLAVEQLISVMVGMLNRSIAEQGGI